MAERENEILRRIIPQLFPEGISRYLDFACGTGRITSVVEKFAHASLGLDISESMITGARRKCTRAEFLVADITRESIDIEPVNCVSAFRFFGNAQDELRNAVLGKLSSQVVKGGYLVVNNHRNPLSLHELLMRVKGGSPETDLSYWKLKTMLAEHGFKIVRTIGVGLWVCRHTLRVAPYDSWLRHLEPISRVRLLGPFCPDAVVVAQRT